MQRKGLFRRCGALQGGVNVNDGNVDIPVIVEVVSVPPVDCDW